MPTLPPVVRHDLVFRTLELTAVADLSPRLRRVRLGGEALKGLASVGPTDHVKLLVPGAGETAIEMPQMDNGRIHFPSGRPPLRDYTIRRHLDGTDEIELDIVVHGEGHVSPWAKTAEVGAVVGLGGPRGSHPMPQADNYLLIGDLSSLPAIARWAEELPSSAAAQVLVAGHGPEDEIPIESRARIVTHWIHSSDPVPADQLTAGLDLIDFTRPDLYIWAAGEVLALRSVRDRLRDEFALSGEYVGVDGYWRRGQADYDHHTPLDG